MQKIIKSEITNLVNSGSKIEDIAKALNIPKLRVRQALKHFGLRIKSTRGESFEFVDDTKTSETPVATVVIPEDRGGWQIVDSVSITTEKVEDELLTLDLAKDEIVEGTEVVEEDDSF